MSRLPIVNFKIMEKVPLRLGFEAVRQKGSHVFYRHPDQSFLKFGELSPYILSFLLPFPPILE